MSFDIYFCGRRTKAPTFDDFRRYFAAIPHFKINVTKQGFQAWYENPQTGVYCSFDCGPDDDEDVPPEFPEGFLNTELRFNLNYNRPCFFAMEAMPHVVAVADRFGLLLLDPQEVGEGTANQPRAFSVPQLIATWQRHNDAAIRNLHRDATTRCEYLYYPRERAVYWWRYMQDVDRLQDLAGDSVFVPQILLVQFEGESILRSAVVWTNALPQIFPVVDIVIKNVALDETYEPIELQVLPYARVVSELRPLLVPQKGSVDGLQLLPDAEKSTIRSTFERVCGDAGKKYWIVRADQFVDVFLPDRLPSRIQ